MAKKATTKSRHLKVTQAFDQLYNTKEEIRGKKVRKYNYDYCLSKVGDQFDYEPETLRRIINGYV